MPRKKQEPEPTMVLTDLSDLPEGTTFRVVDDEELEDGDVVAEFTIPIPAAETVLPAEKWTDAELFAVRKFGPAIIGQEMYEAKERRIKATGNGVLGPAVTLSAEEHDKAVAAHQAKLAERAKEAERRIAAEKLSRQQRYEQALHSPFPTKPAA